MSAINNRTWHRAHGLSLVELLIAMTLGIVLTTSMIAVFAGNKRSADLNTALSNIQENARYALGAISRDIRMAGYQGCLDMRKGSMAVQAANPPLAIHADKPIRPDGAPNYDFAASATTGATVITSDNWEPPIPGGFVPSTLFPAVPGTHAISLMFGSRNQSEINGQMLIGPKPQTNAPIRTKSNLGFQPGDFAIIANCDYVDLFTVTSAALDQDGQILGHTAASNWSGNVQIPYGAEISKRQTTIMRLVGNVYYVGNTGLFNDSGDSITALYSQSIPYNDPTNPPVELVQGVENMRVSYGININGAISYVSADDPAFNPANVESIQIGLLMSSWDQISEQADESTYFLAGQEIAPSSNSTDATTHPNDRRFRLVFNTTVKVRNRRNDGA